MRPRTLAERAAFVSAAIGIAVGLLFLFAPIQGYCMSSASATAPPLGATPGPPVTFGRTGNRLRRGTAARPR